MSNTEFYSQFTREIWEFQISNLSFLLVSQIKGNVIVSQNIDYGVTKPLPRLEGAKRLLVSSHEGNLGFKKQILSLGSTGDIFRSEKHWARQRQEHIETTHVIGRKDWYYVHFPKLLKVWVCLDEQEALYNKMDYVSDIILEMKDRDQCRFYI